jgi:hypothetical protein
MGGAIDLILSQTFIVPMRFPAFWPNPGTRWVLCLWLLSRFVILGSMVLIAPHLPWPHTTYSYFIPGFPGSFHPTPQWSLLTHWDGAWYQRIAETGYQYSPNAGMQTIVFLPLYPLLCRLIMAIGIPFEIAGAIVSNLSFLAALLILYRYLSEKYSPSLARWSTASLALFPCALFTTVNYTESLFLLCTIASLTSFDTKHYAKATLWGILATACRPPGILLIPALLWASYRDRRGKIAYLASGAMVLGFLSFLLYCGLALGNPFATFQGHQAWAKGVISWPNILARLSQSNAQGAGAWIRVITLGGAIALLARSRNVLSTADRTYSCLTLGLLLLSNSTEGLVRYFYGVAPLSWALGHQLALWHRQGHHGLLWSTLVASILGLIGFSVRFAWWLWVS